MNTGAALGVAFVSAFLALGVSLGFDFSTATKGPSGPDLHKIITAIDPKTVPEDVRDETFHAVKDDERPQARDWVAIWGGRLNTYTSPPCANKSKPPQLPAHSRFSSPS